MFYFDMPRPMNYRWGLCHRDYLWQRAYPYSNHPSCMCHVCAGGDAGSTEQGERQITADARAAAFDLFGRRLKGERHFRNFFRRARLDRQQVADALRVLLAKRDAQALWPRPYQGVGAARDRHERIVARHMAHMEADRQATYAALRSVVRGGTLPDPPHRDMQRRIFTGLERIRRHASRRIQSELGFPADDVLFNNE